MKQQPTQQAIDRAKEWSAMHDQGMSLREIANRAGVCPQRVHQVLKKYGMDTSYHPNPNRKPTSDDHIRRFWSKVAVTPDANDCWEWTKTKNAKGYGHFSIGNTYIQSHRFSWQIANGEIPNGLCVLHKCDNPSCVNPNHLFLGTNDDNVRDRVSKGRSARIRRCGENNPGHKLTADQVRCIRDTYKAGGVSQRQLEERFGLPRGYVCVIVNRKVWKSI